MPLPQKWNRKKQPPPQGFDVVEPVLEALENELRDKVKETDPKQRKNEAIWPVHQINWQKTRYIYDLYHTHKRINRAVYQYCLDQKLVDAALIAKWKKQGYERLCSTYVINQSNYKFGTTSFCRVPWKDRTEEQKTAQDPTTGCRGCASGKKNAGPRNIFGNKYGQNLAAVQIAREKRMERKQMEEEQRRLQEQQRIAGEDETDSDDDDYGPTPTAGIWAGSQQLQDESAKLADPDGEAETDDEEEEGPPPSKRVKPNDG